MAEDKSSGNTPSADNPVNPTGGDKTPSQQRTEATVTLSKKEHDELQRKAAQAEEAQSRADQLQNETKRFGKKKLERQDEAMTNTELADARNKITARVLATKEYQELTASNPELAKILTTRPWDLLDEDQFIDANDLANQVLDFLDGRVKSSKASSTPAPSSTTEPPAPLPTKPSNDGAPPAQHPDEEAAEKRRANMKPLERIEDKLIGRIKI